MKILLISGHGAGDPGAIGSGYKESDLTREATNILYGKLKAYDLGVTRYPTNHNAYEDNKKSNMQVSFASYNLVIEVHFNSYNKKAHGTETLYKAASIKPLAEKVTDAIASFGFTDRGVKKRTDLLNMNTCYRKGVSYILIETCFIDNAEDMKRYKTNIYNIWGKVAKTICDYYGIKENASNGQAVAVKKPTKKATSKIDVDGSWGQDTTRLAQKVFGTSVDGVVSNQPMANKRYLPNCSAYSWQFKYSGYKSGSELIRAIQRRIGADVDGFCGKNTVKALQKFLGVKVDGSCGFYTVSAFQKYLNSKVK